MTGRDAPGAKQRRARVRDIQAIRDGLDAARAVMRTAERTPELYRLAETVAVLEGRFGRRIDNLENSPDLNERN